MVMVTFGNLQPGWAIIPITTLAMSLKPYALVQRAASIKAFHCFGQQYTQELCNKITSQNVLCQQVDVKEYLFLCNNMWFFNQLMQQICQFDLWWCLIYIVTCNLNDMIRIRSVMFYSAALFDTATCLKLKPVLYRHTYITWHENRKPIPEKYIWGLKRISLSFWGHEIAVPHLIGSEQHCCDSQSHVWHFRWWC